MIEAYVLGRPIPSSSSAGQRGFAEAIRRLSGVILGLQLVARQLLPDGHAGQHDLAFGQVGFRIVAPFDVRPQVAGKIDRLAAGLKQSPLPLRW